ncbi:MAG: imidazole glycerol phosphate synthase subunit HisH [Myxococcota bacterium]
MATPPTIAIVDYGAGNLRSVARALERSQLRPQVTSTPREVVAADGVVLPGVGAFRDAILRLEKAGLDDALREVLGRGRPYLGLCLGLQVLFDESDEHGQTAGLGVLAGRVERFPDTDSAGARLRVPQIGWNEVHFEGDHPMLAGLPERDYFYFVHSYRAVPSDPSCVVGTANHGGDFTAAVATEGLFAVQFHPEKSQAAGRRLLDAFRDWVEARR